MRYLLLLPPLVSACNPSDPGDITPDPLGGITVVSEDPSDNPLPGLSSDWTDQFVKGDAHFEAPLREEQGLGPLYIRQSCASCHMDDGKGPGTVTKMVLVGDDGYTPLADQSALPYGHTVRPQLAAGATTPILPPEELASLRTSLRVGPAVFGRGYLEAIDEAEIERMEAEQLDNPNGVSGQVSRVVWTSSMASDSQFFDFQPGESGIIGRFGVKARIGSLDEFAADAYQGDMGITTPYRPDELPNPDGLTDDYHPGIDVTVDVVHEVGNYLRLLDIPRRDGLTLAGEVAFAAAQCDSCHVPSLKTRVDYPIPQLAGIDAPVFTDMLLHDMGEELADGMADGSATPREWRTAPLMGLRFMMGYLHDGRADTIEEAILKHRSEGSEATVSVDLFETLSAAQREDLISYVENL